MKNGDGFLLHHNTNLSLTLADAMPNFHGTIIASLRRAKFLTVYIESKMKETGEKIKLLPREFVAALENMKPHSKDCMLFSCEQCEKEETSISITTSDQERDGENNVNDVSTSAYNRPPLLSDSDFEEYFVTRYGRESSYKEPEKKETATSITSSDHERDNESEGFFDNYTYPPDMTVSDLEELFL